MYHAPSRPAGDIALLICSPFGNEDLCAYRSLRQLALSTADSGIATLRFDYAACGNSEGADAEADLHAWIGNITQACATLRQLSGATRVVLLGLRLGALLATLAAPNCKGVVDLITIAPVVSGRAYLRELKALHLAGEASKLIQRDSDAGPELFESGGFVIAQALHDALSAIDLTKLETPPALSMLLVDRDDLPGNDRFAKRLQSQGVQVSQTSLAGYAAMMADPHLCEPPPSLPTMVIDRIREVSSLGVATHHLPPDGLADEPGATTQLNNLPGQNTAIEETAQYIGHEPPLMCLLTTRGQPAKSPRSGLGILMLNAGATRLTGPSRLYVKLAREWGALGHTVMRLDIAGLGDSPPHAGHADNVVYSDRALNDVATAIAHLRSQPDVHRVIVMGLCSGAYHAFKSAAQLLPADCIVMINPLTFYWIPGSTLQSPSAMQISIAQDVQRHRRSLLKAGTWVKLARGGLTPQRAFQIIKQSTAWIHDMAYRAIARSVGLPIKDDLAGDLAQIANRGVAMHFVFATGDPGWTLLHALGGKAVPRMQQNKQLDLRLIAQADHTFTQISPRRALEATLHDIVQSQHQRFD
jgi:alpha-beta hydrolase superfamily lysophospholipase